MIFGDNYPSQHECIESGFCQRFLFSASGLPSSISSTDWQLFCKQAHPSCPWCLIFGMEGLQL